MATGEQGKYPSRELAAIVGAGPMTVSEAINRVLAYVEKHNLYDEKNRRIIRPDNTLTAALDGKAQLTRDELEPMVLKCLHATDWEGPGITGRSHGDKR